MLTSEEARGLDGWWAVVMVDAGKQGSPIVAHEPVSGETIRASRRGRWDDRFVPQEFCAGISAFTRRADEWARQARKGPGPVLIGFPAAFAALLFDLPVMKFGDEDQDDDEANGHAPARGCGVLTTP